jgi:hypothetical protein
MIRPLGQALARAAASRYTDAGSLPATHFGMPTSDQRLPTACPRCFSKSVGCRGWSFTTRMETPQLSNGTTISRGSSGGPASGSSARTPDAPSKQFAGFRAKACGVLFLDVAFQIVRLSVPRSVDKSTNEWGDTSVPLHRHELAR